MIVKDMMPAFELYQPTQLKDALALLDRYRQGRLEDGRRLRQPELVQGTQQAAQGRDRPHRHRRDEGHSRNRRRHRDRRADHADRDRAQSDDPVRNTACLPMRLGRVASPQIRNTGTMGGNVSQDARCLYYRYGLPCYRAGGNTCFADTPEGVNREHALFDADRCIAVSSIGHRARAGRAGRQVRDPQLEGRAGRSARRNSSSARRSTSRT